MDRDPPRARGRFVGRSAELAVLREEFARSRNGPGRVVLVTGDTGVGKSRLVAEFLARHVTDGARGNEVGTSALALLGGCMPRHGELLPYAPLWDAANRFSLPLSAREGEAVRARDRLSRHLRSISAPAEAEQAHEKLLPPVVATTLALERLREDRQLVLVLEDLHWGDPSTQALLTYLVRTGRPKGALVIGTYRDDEPTQHSSHSWPAELELMGARRLWLAELDHDTAGAVARAMLGPGEAVSRVESVVERSGGNPLALEQLCLSAEGAGPTSLADILTARVESLSPRSRSVLNAVAVAGGRVSHRLLAHVMALEDSVLLTALDEARRRYLVRSGPGREYALRHPLMGEVLYGTMLPGERQGYHRALALTLTRHPHLSGQQGSGLWAQVAHHFGAADEHEDALGALLRAGLAAHEVSAVSEARRHLSRAEALWSLLPEADRALPTGRDELRLHLAEVSYLDGDATVAVQWIRRVLNGLDTASSPVKAAVLYERLGRYLWAAGRSSAEMLAACREAVRHAPHSAPRERAQALASMAQALLLSTRFTEADEECRQALQLAEAAGIPRVAAHAATTLGVVESLSGRQASGIARLRVAAGIADAHGLPEDRLRARGNLGVTLALAGRMQEAADVLLPTLDQAKSWDMEDSHGAFLLSNALGVLFDLGRWDEVEERLRDARVGAGSLRASAALDIVSARIRAARGDFDASEHLLQRVGARLDEGGDSWANGQLLVARTELATWRSDHSASRLCTREFLELHGTATPDNEMRAEALAPLMRAEAEHRRFRRATGLPLRTEDNSTVTRLVDHLASLENRSVSPVAAAHLASARAELARMSDDAAPSVWRALASRYRKLANPVNIAYARWREAEALALAKEERPRALRGLTEALQTAESLRLEPMLHDLRKLSESLELRPASKSVRKATPEAAVRPSQPVTSLSPRQQEVLRRLARGDTNRQISEELFISEKTVAIHVSRLLAKLGATNRGQAAAMAHQQGW
ncbi:helix-turn-helix transcriptional regulator [Streptomyces parvus]|uniref:AAA family ATPase n=1 Tax=Streptomyces parvus TaxID=66428 RepID=A0A5D4JLZ5_9ACTN|nr:helix-turn-helix transcriptional regulator [Streptomyces parvus]TYR65355.1 AAA family ATPase [Streptomyces parvus]